VPVTVFRVQVPVPVGFIVSAVPVGTRMLYGRQLGPSRQQGSDLPTNSSRHPSLSQVPEGLRDPLLRIEALPGPRGFS
jgi:hypothetical protein